MPKVERPKTILDLDHEFDEGSGINIAALSKAQIENLVKLGKVWGFLKYHHPAIASGQLHWDYALFRVLPQIVAAPGAATATAVLRKWIAGLGSVPDCTHCASLNEADLYMRPELKWISDGNLLGPDLSKDLQKIFRNRAAAGNSFFVSLAQGVGNPVFDHEPGYPKIKLPDSGYQILALYRVWNIIAVVAGYHSRKLVWGLV